MGGAVKEFFRDYPAERRVVALLPGGMDQDSGKMTCTFKPPPAAVLSSTLPP
jgi:hypothetical protein